MAWRGKEPVGRISAAINHRFNDYHNARIGFFGFFDVVEDYEVAKALLDQVQSWVKGYGVSVLRGPGEYSTVTYERQGVLVDGFQHPPTMELTHNHSYYGAFLDNYGFHKAKDYFAYTFDVQTSIPSRLKKLVDQVRIRRDIQTRPLNIKKLTDDVRLIADIYNDSWTKNWGFLPITDVEAKAIADSLRLIVDPGLVRFAFIGGEPAAVLGAFPDPYYVLRPRWRWYGDSDLIRTARLLLMRRRIPNTRLMFFGIRPGFRQLGIDALLFYEAKEYGIQRGYSKCETSMLLEDNQLILRASEFMGARQYKTWRIYELLIE